MGIASLVIGILAIILGVIPACGLIIALPPAIVGIILGIVDITKKSKKGEPKKLGTAGVILNVIAILVIIAMTALFVNRAKDVAPEFESAMREAAAEMEKAAEEAQKAAREAQESVPAPPADE